MGASNSAGAYDHRRLIDTLTDPVFVLDVSAADAIRIVDANAACASFFGVLASQCTNRPIAEVLPAPVAVRVAAECERCTSTRQQVEFRLDLRTIVGKAFDVRLNVITDGNEDARIAVVARVAGAHDSVEPDAGVGQFRVIAEYAADYISRLDREGRVLYLNPAVERLMGVKYELLVGKDVDVWAGHLPHKERHLSNIRRVVETGEPHMIELEFVDASTGQAIYHQVSHAPEWDQHGDVVSVIGIGRDITQLKAAESELRMLNATLEERVAARTMDLERANRDLRSFASTVSHDLRAPLRAISGYADLIGRDDGERLSGSGRAMLAKIAAAVEKLEHLIDAILSYSKAGQRALASERVHMEAAAREVSEELIGHSQIRIDIAELPAAHADVTMVRQILQNLIGNAIKFSVKSEQPRIEVGWQELAGQVVYYVRDNGLGFDMQYANKLFSMFERLHGSGEFPGSGVGLAIVKRLVERHGGRVWAESRPGAGATFYFTLSPKSRNGNHHPSAEPSGLVS